MQRDFEIESRSTLNIENAFHQKDIIVSNDITRLVIKILIFESFAISAGSLKSHPDISGKHYENVETMRFEVVSANDAIEETKTKIFSLRRGD